MGIFDWFRQKNSKDMPKSDKMQSVSTKKESYSVIEIKQSEVKQDDFIKQKEIYFPDVPKYERVRVEKIELTYEQAYEQGWHFKIKSRKRIRITRYTGTKKEIVIPSKIGEYTVNELGKGLFFREKIDSIKIPDTVKKIGASCLSQSTVRGIIFDEGVLIIPNGFAFSCQQLKYVHLPNTLCRIENCAFESCKKLKYIIIPRRCGFIGHSVFARSGLEGFAYYDRRFAEISGDSFEFTPLEEKYKLILRAAPDQKNGYRILLVGRRANGVKLPSGKVFLGNYSLLSGYRHMGILDFSWCTEIYADTNACQLVYSFDGNVYHTTDCKIVVPQGTIGVYFPESLSVTYPSGRKYDGYCSTVSKTEDSIILRKHTEFLSAYSILCSEKNVFIHTQKWANFEQYAVCSKDIEHISFSYLHRGEGELFAPYCEALHRVEWGEKFVQIPPSRFVGKKLHDKLLKAFVGRNNGGIVYIFDGSVIDRLFFNYDSKPKISQKKRIMIAVDVLQSTGSLFPNREMYRRYLQTHKRYALILRNELPQEYADFLKKIYEVEK